MLLFTSLICEIKHNVPPFWRGIFLGVIVGTITSRFGQIRPLEPAARQMGRCLNAASVRGPRFLSGLLDTRLTKKSLVWPTGAGESLLLSFL